MNGRAGAAAFRRSPSSAVYEHYRRTRTLDILITTYVHAKRTPTRARTIHVQHEPRPFSRYALVCRRALARATSTFRSRRDSTSVNAALERPRPRSRASALARKPLASSDISSVSPS